MSWYEKSDIVNSEVEDIILSYDLNREAIVEAKLIGEVEELISESAEKFKLILENRHLELTVYHIIPFWRNGELIEDNCGVVEVGDELLCINSEELNVRKEKIIEIEVGMTDNTPVRHPKSSNGYYFVNGILLHD
jgi:hypothetical protein|tara:strand:- start:1184 stop:1588 length:405 start_codon:yes stop_codon:yes gene_type:complete